MRAWLEWAIARGEIKTEKDFSKNGAKQTFFFFFDQKDPNVENYSVFRRGWGVAVTMTWDDGGAGGRPDVWPQMLTGVWA